MSGSSSLLLSLPVLPLDLFNLFVMFVTQDVVHSLCFSLIERQSVVHLFCGITLESAATAFFSRLHHDPKPYLSDELQLEYRQLSDERERLF